MTYSSNPRHLRAKHSHQTPSIFGIISEAMRIQGVYGVPAADHGRRHGHRRTDG